MTKPVTIPNTFATATTAIPLSQLDSDFSTVATALNDANTYSNYAADTGVANAYVVTLTGVSTTYSAGLRIQFKAGNANTGASTLNVNGGGTKNITFQDASALSSGTIAANAIVDVMYDGTQFLLMNDPAGATGGDVVGPSSATANAVVRFDSTTGKLVKNSVVTIADSTGDMSGVGAFTATGNVTLGDATTDTITLTGTVQPGVVISGSSSGDALRITQTGAGNALLVEDAANPDSTPFVVTAAGDVGIGTSSPSNLLDVYKDSGTAYSSANVLSMGQWARISNPNTTSGTGVSLLFRANASSLAAVSCVSTAASNSAALTFAARQSDGTLAEQMRLDASGNVGIGATTAGTRLVLATDDSATTGQLRFARSADVSYFWEIGRDNNLTGAFVFSNASGGAKTERARITSGGNLDLQKNLGLGGTSATTSGTGITFPATQSASTDANTLDDYEEGTWTPAYSGTTGSAGSYAATSSGTYTKVGRMVTAIGSITLTNKGSWTGNILLSLPSLGDTISTVSGTIIVENVTLGANTRSVTSYTYAALMAAYGPSLYVNETVTGGATVNTTCANATNTSSFVYSITYFV